MFSGNVVLSPYRNPPYRAPAHRTMPVNTPPPPSPRRSPKRKRSDGSAALQVATTVPSPGVKRAGDDLVSPSGADSPRNKVAERFNDLVLHHSSAQQAGQNSEDLVTPRKRIKQLLDLAAASPSDDQITAEENQLDSAGRSETPEIEETPDCRKRGESPCPLRPTELFRQAHSLPEPAAISESRVSPTPSPPTPFTFSSQTSQLPANIPHNKRPGSPLPTSRNLTPDQAALTWREDEITGHEIDERGGDDGEGINGIGFRPTPAEAYARQQRRRQQVSEWRAREAREARQRRFERRRGGAHGRSEAAVRQVVRFAEVG